MTLSQVILKNYINWSKNIGNLESGKMPLYFSPLLCPPQYSSFNEGDYNKCSCIFFRLLSFISWSLLTSPSLTRPSCTIISLFQDSSSADIIAKHTRAGQEGPQLLTPNSSRVCHFKGLWGDIHFDVTWNVCRDSPCFFLSFLLLLELWLL